VVTETTYGNLGCPAAKQNGDFIAQVKKVLVRWSGAGADLAWDVLKMC